MCSRLPIIVILGATGSGKSKLGIELARKYAGEIISADSMQVYRGLDVVTNKVTKEERAAAPHHMIDVVDPLRRFTVVDFRNLALTEIRRIHEHGKLPIIVGGTNYYIESLLWQVLVEPQRFCDPTSPPESLTLMWERDPQKRPAPSISDTSNKRHKSPDDVRDSSSNTILDVRDSSHNNASNILDIRDSSPTRDSNGDISEPSSDKESAEAPDISDNWESMTNAELHAKLMCLDPDTASTLHPNNRRKIIRSLQVWHSEGRALSSVLREQRSSDGGSSLGGPLRYPRSAILWLQCEQSILDERLDKRVDAMIEQGLIAELLDFHARYNKERLAENLAADYTAGIFQSIGLKEFHNYLLLPESERNGEAGRVLLQEGVDMLKLATRRYARRQVRWVINRFLRRPDRQVPPVYGLDTSDPSKWDEIVLDPASKIVESLVSGDHGTGVPEPLPIRDALETAPCNHHCNICDRVFVDLAQWNTHLASKKHKKQLARLNKEKSKSINETVTV